MKKLAVFAIALVLVSCQAEKTTQGARPTNLSLVDELDMGNGHYTVKVYDKTSHNVCYIYTAYDRGGISCLPDAK
jgi:hypothetical protein